MSWLPVRTAPHYRRALVMPALLLALELGGVQHLGATAAGMAVLAPRVAGLFLFSTAAIALFTHANSLMTAREDAVLRRWRVAPLPPGAYFAAKTAATVLAADLAGVILVLASVELARLRLTGHAVAAMLVIGTFGALAFATAGTAITALISTAQSAQPVLMLIYLPLVFLSGAFGPDQSGGPLMTAHDVAVLAGWLAGASCSRCGSSAGTRTGRATRGHGDRRTNRIPPCFSCSCTMATTSRGHWPA